MMGIEWLKPGIFVGSALFALLGASAVQRGPLWWASQHRHHHAHADDEQDVARPQEPPEVVGTPAVA